MAAIYLAVLAVLLVVVIYCVCRAGGRRSDALEGKPDWLSVDRLCPPAYPAPHELHSIVVGRIRGAPAAKTSYVGTAKECAAQCASGGTGAPCSGWAFEKSRPGPGGYACQLLTVDDKDLAIVPPASRGDYVSHSLTCASRAGPGGVGVPIPETVVIGSPPPKSSILSSAEACLKACQKDSKCIGASYHAPLSRCDLHEKKGILSLLTLPGSNHVSSASFFSGVVAVPFAPASLPA